MQNNAAELNEQESLNDLLNQEKQIATNYATFITEASCQNLRRVLTDNLNSSLNDQFQIYNMMKNKGYYPAKDASGQDVQQAKNKYQQYCNQINCQ